MSIDMFTKAHKVYSLLKEDDDVLTTKTLNLYLKQFRCPEYNCKARLISVEDFAVDLKEF